MRDVNRSARWFDYLMVAITAVCALIVVSLGEAKAAIPKPGKGKPSASVNCVVPELRQLISTVQTKFGPVQVISTCRPGAKIRGTGKASLHASGRAVDFRTKNKRAVVSWLRSQGRYGVMTYTNSSHIHVDVGRGGYYAVGRA